jgi:hypothetical protein
VLDRFAPNATGASPPLQSEEVTMLIATDLCSEGLNLQDASVLVHLDMPWTPARIEQRVGRIARSGSVHSQVMIHTLTVPAIADDILRIAERLEEKARFERRVNAVPDTQEDILAILESWPQQPGIRLDTRILIGYAAAELDCFLCVASDGNRSVLVAGDSLSVTDNPARVLTYLRAIRGDDAADSEDAATTIIDRIKQWLEQQALEKSLRLTPVGSVRQRRVTRRINQLAGASPTHLRGDTSLLADRARHAMAMDHNAGTERMIADLADSQPSSNHLLDQISAFEEIFSKQEAGPNGGSGFRIRALLIGRKSAGG